MATIHSSISYDYKIIEVRGKFFVCFKSNKIKGVIWSRLTGSEPTLQHAINRMMACIETDETDELMQKEGIDFDINPKSEL